MTSTGTAISTARRRPRHIVALAFAGALLLGLAAAPGAPATAQTPGGSLLAKAAQKSGKPFKECDECPEMVVIPPGNYWMGRDDGKSVETPAVPVAILKSFALSRF